MEELPKDALFSLAVEMELPDLLNFCRTNSRIHTICSEKYVWLNKLKKDFQYQYTGIFSPEETYVILYKWKQTDKPAISAFSSPVYLKQPLIDFFSNADFGKTESGIPIRNIVLPLIMKGVMNRNLITVLLTLYVKVNNLSSVGADGRKYLSAGPDMEKYLGSYLDDLETADRSKTDAEMLDMRGNSKLRFNRNQFVFSRLMSIANSGIYKRDELTESQSELLKDELIGKALTLIEPKLRIH